MKTILAADIGAGTQDLFLFEEGTNIENCIKMVLPSRTTLLSRRMENYTKNGSPVFLYGKNMGSGRFGSAVKKHIKAGYEVYATSSSARTFRDNPQEVMALGIKISEKPPVDMPEIKLSDIDFESIHKLISDFDRPLPDYYLIAVQDHGECLEGSNRKIRFNYWKEFIEKSGDLKSLLFSDIPPIFTRMQAVKSDVANSSIMDTGPAALLGSLYDEHVGIVESEKGAVVVNVGNQHTLGALLKKGRILGLFEHHTCFMSKDKIKEIIDKFRFNKLSDEEIYLEKGHGCYIHCDYQMEKAFDFVSVTGPMRHLVDGLNYHNAAPFGDMMLTGCFGMLGAFGKLDSYNLR